MFNLIFVLLLTKVYLFIKKQDYKIYIFMTFYLNNFKIVFILLAKIIILHLQVFNIEIKIFNFKKPI